MSNLETARRVIDVRIRNFSEIRERVYREEYLERGLNNRFFFEDGHSSKWIIRGYTDVIGGMGDSGVIFLPELIDAEIQKKGKVRILDVGCGRGRFLIDCKKRWGEKVEGVGVTTDPSHINEASKTLNIEGIERAPTGPELERLGISIINGDAQRLPYLLRTNNVSANFDIAVSIFVFQYLSDPLAAIKGIHSSLATGGIGLISPHNFKYDSAWQALDLMENQGICIDRDLITVSKNNPHLVMPVRYEVSDGRIGYVPSRKEDMKDWNKSFIIPL